MKKEKRTLNQTWILCLRMWRSIAKNWNGRKKIYHQKRLWLKQNGFRIYEVSANCFFCDYNKNDDDCDLCPGRLVDPDFNCLNIAYHYRNKPVEFYKELLRLNRIRKAKT